MDQNLVVKGDYLDGLRKKINSFSLFENIKLKNFFIFNIEQKYFKHL
jgi:hypothetical protein